MPKPKEELNPKVNVFKLMCENEKLKLLCDQKSKEIKELMKINYSLKDSLNKMRQEKIDKTEHEKLAEQVIKLVKKIEGWNEDF